VFGDINTNIMFFFLINKVYKYYGCYWFSWSK
jgi:hypothetical protein